MLQQTQVSRVLPKYDEFLYLFPDVYTLAGARLSKVLIVWKGLGYNRRALYLKKTAEALVQKHYGEFPDSEAELIKLPGLGRYTARALLVFAFQKDVAMVDTNIRQIITHFFFNGRQQKEKTIQDIADQLVPPGNAWAWHQALMDYGALELVRKKSAGKSDATQNVPFRETNRFYRGRVMDRLRESAVFEKQLVRDFSKSFRKPPSYIRSIITSLMKDGLVLRKGARIRLPE